MTTDADDRARIRTAHDETLFVEAGAGTGKTTALVARVVDMVAKGSLHDVAGLAAISFTENAAADLRSRIRHGLEEGSRGEHRGVPYDEPAQQRCREALTRLDDAVITTLHGFAARILSEAPIEAGLPPGFAVADTMTSSPGTELAWRSFLDDLLDDGAVTPHVIAGLTLGMKLDDLHDVADVLGASWDRLRERPLERRELPDVSADKVVDALRVALADEDRWPAGDGLAQHLDTSTRSALRELEALEHPDDLLEALGRLGKLTCRLGNKKAWSDAGLDKQDVVEALERAQQARDESVGSIGAAVTETLSARVQDWLLEEADRRRALGMLEYHDLLVLARDLLRRDHDVRQRLAQQWPVLMIDEFQDTDPIQVELAYLLAGAVEGEPPATWSDITVTGGRVFFVGDAKQSIYRFRRADVRLFSAVGQNHAKGRASLRVNFRSVPGVLDAANHAFRELMGRDPAQQDLRYSDLEVQRADPDEGTHVLLLGGPHDADAAALRQLEADHLADVISRARGSWKVEGEELQADGSTKPCVRPARYQDMAVLVPTRTPLPALERFLQGRGVPYRVESRSLVWSTDAVRDLVTLLQAVDDPADEVALLSALRHPGLACSDVDLVTWRAAGGRWSLFAAVPDGVDADSPVPAALRTLRSWHDQRWWLPVNELVEQVVRELRLVELTASQRRPRDHWRRIRFLVDQARAWCDAGGSGLGGFVAWAVRQVESDADVLETVVPEPDDDAVRILTVHGAKGLEFPITLVAGLSGTGRGATKVVWTDDGPVIRLRAEGGLETPGWAAAVADDREQERQEAVRLLYVALTRAQDHLVLGCYHKPPKGKDAQRSAAQRLWELLSPTSSVTTEVEAAAASAVSTTQAVPEDIDLSQREAFVTERTALLQAVQARVATNPTALAASADEPEKDADVGATADGTAARGRSSRRGAAIGTAVHRVLELADLRSATDDELLRLARLACAEGGIEPLIADVAGRARTALSAEVVQTALPDRSRREVYVVVRDGERYVEGYIDLLAEQPDGSLAVVDYKTDRVDNAADIAAKQEQYRPQLEAYAWAVEKVTSRRPERWELVFAGPRPPGAQR